MNYLGRHVRDGAVRARGDGLALLQRARLRGTAPQKHISGFQTCNAAYHLMIVQTSTVRRAKEGAKPSAGISHTLQSVHRPGAQCSTSTTHQAKVGDLGHKAAAPVIGGRPAGRQHHVPPRQVT